MTVIFLVLLFVVAFLYASVGHGGASGYLALMVFFDFAPETMRPTALILNVFVSLISFAQYYRAGHFSWKMFWPYALLSVPMAFLGGQITVDAALYKKILGALLLFPIARLAFLNIKNEHFIKKTNLPLAVGIGAIIGLFSGMIGIGGGIILSPIILLFKWADMKQTAAISALFILVNSLAGLFGLFSKGFEMQPETYPMIAVAVAGGLAGAYFGALKFGGLVLKRILAVVLLIASIKLLTSI